MGKAYLASDTAQFKEILQSLAEKRQESGDVLSLSKEDKENMMFIIENWAKDKETPFQAVPAILRSLGRLEFSFRNPEDRPILRKLVKKFEFNNYHMTRTFMRTLKSVHFYDHLTEKKITFLLSIYSYLFDDDDISVSDFMENLKCISKSGMGNHQLGKPLHSQLLRLSRRLEPDITPTWRTFLKKFYIELQRREKEMKESAMKNKKSTSTKPIIK
jgi:hypothetical protein